MIGRERELEIVESAFAAAKRDRVPSVVRIGGESGIGKTLFLAQLARRFEARGWLVVQTACHAIQQNTPRLVSNRVTFAVLQRLGPDAARYTGGLEDELASFDASIARAIAVVPSTQTLDADSYAFTFLRLFEGIAVDYDMAILCDDAQWIDADSARTLLALPQKVSTGCISLTIAERDDDDSHARRWLQSTEICLKRLTFEDSLRLIAAELPDLDPQKAAMLAHQTAGRPLELVTLCESIRTGQSTDVERSFRGHVARQLSSLDSDVREFVALCALLTEPIEQRILLQLYPNPAHLEQMIERAGRYVAVGPFGLEFRHAILAHSVASTIAVPIPLHKRIIAALASLPSPELTDYERIARHAAACGDRALEAQAYLQLVEQASLRDAWSVVIAASERALALRDETMRSPEFLTKYIHALRAYDREVEAADFLLRELPALSRSSPRRGMGHVVSMLVIMLAELEMVEQATAIFRKYFPELADPEERLALVRAMKFGAVLSADDELFAELDATLESFRDVVPSQLLVAPADAAYASLDGDAERAREIAATVLTYANPNHPRYVLLLEFGSMMWGFRHAGVRPLSARLPLLNERARKIGDIGYGKTCEVWEAFFRGDWDGALRAISDYYRDDIPVPRAAALLSVAAAIEALTNGQTRFTEEIERVCFGTLEGDYRQSAMQLLPWRLVRGFDQALDEFARHIAADIAVRPPPFSALGYFPAGFVLWAGARSHTEVLRRIASLEATRDRSTWARAHWTLTRGLALQALKAVDAKPCLAQAAQSFRALSAPFFAAYAAHYAGNSTPEERELLARLGVTKSKASTQKRGATDLTRREWEVARLVGSGASNRKIAEGLFLSERTIEVHLGNIFGKLNLASRAQLVRWLFENEAPTPTP